MRAVVIVNPNATATNQYQRDVIVAALDGAFDLTTVQTTHRDHATEVAQRAAADGFDAVIAHGGDGTVNETVNGLLHAGPGPGVPLLGIIPGGSANVMARNLGLPSTPILATRALLTAVRDPRRPRTRSVGLGQVDDRWFTFNAGFGLDAKAVHNVELARSRGKRASPSLYLRSAVRAYLGQAHGEGPISVTVDENPPQTGLELLLVTNSSPWTYMGSVAVRATPRASFDAGLDVLGSTKLGLPRLLGYGAQILLGRRGAHGEHVVAAHDVHSVRVTIERPMPFQVDGDYLGEVQAASFRAVPHALRVLIS